MPPTRLGERPLKHLAVVLLAASLGGVSLSAGHLWLLHNLSIFRGAHGVADITNFFDQIKLYLLGIILGGATVAGIAVGAAKFVGHSRANDMIFNIGAGIVVLALIPTFVA